MTQPSFGCHDSAHFRTSTPGHLNFSHDFLAFPSFNSALPLIPLWSFFCQSRISLRQQNGQGCSCTRCSPLLLLHCGFVPPDCGFRVLTVCWSVAADTVRLVQIVHVCSSSPQRDGSSKSRASRYSSPSMVRKELLDRHGEFS